MKTDRRWRLGILCAASVLAGGIGIAQEHAWVNSVGMKMVRIPAGEFTQGSPSSEPGHQPDERQRQVTVGKPFFMAATEVTQSQWNALMERNPSRVTGNDRPVESVTWKDVQEYLRRLSEKEGKTYRLPTEAEWEYACRAGTSGPFSGSKIEEEAWTDKNSGGTSHDVATLAPNAWGLYDMHGNVAEWCEDIYRPDPTAQDSEGEEETGRCVRGGSWDYADAGCRSAARCGRPASHPHQTVGFRPVVDTE